ncbi:HDOD domain-containing protein [Desulfovibrio psychrotolerans]|uniref:Phosphohydrolase n=1 Tax=Desulfovibrio psychrotolerans TaxID=415242 RepID=A0A7J0BU00_9BACT|nr:HDOD domain-containing protein [Desulfovibrio psychrotolerans]GFM37189.1 phosphohydrolase [Desulfovibrio psychrotolerans]
MKPDSPAAQLALSEEYVRDFFMYADHDNPAIAEIFRLSVFRTGAALRQGWQMPTEDARLMRNTEYLRDTFTPGMVDPKTLVDSEAELVSFPDVYFRIREVLDSPTSSADDVARIVSNDVELTAKLLKLVNSPFYGLLVTVEDVAHAIALVGVTEVSNLALGISAITVFKDIPPELMDVKTFWKHSVSCGVFSKLIASRMGGLKADRFFTAGLLHDVGRLIIMKKLPYASVQTLLYARENMLPLAEAERDILGFDHAEVGGMLLAEWKFPAGLVDTVRWHHAPASAQDPLAASVVQLADNLTNAMEISCGGKYVLPGLQEGAWERLGLKSSDLVTVTALFDSHIEELFAAFL